VQVVIGPFGSRTLIYSLSMKKKAKKSTCDRPKRGGISQFIKRLRPKKTKAAAKSDSTIRLDSSAGYGCAGKRPSIADILLTYRQTGDPQMAAMIFKQYWHLVLGTSVGLLRDRNAAEDAAMDIFQKVLERLRAETPAHFPAWLYIVTRNHCMEMLRKENKAPRLEPLDDVRIAVEPEFVIAKEEENQVLARNVRQALAELPEQQRECIEMFYMQELSYKEIAEESGFSLKMVKSYIQNGKRRLIISLRGCRGRHFSELEAL
jgi:RNA polymerase sigma-70 factor, ECF subfamily